MHMARVSPIILGAFNSTLPNSKPSLIYAASHVTLHGGRISEKGGVEEKEDNDDI